MRLAAFLAFSVVSGFLELGLILAAALGPDPFMAAALMALAYQLGTLVPLPFAVTRPATRALLACGAVLALAVLALAALAIPALPVRMVLVAVLSAVVNLSRMALGKAEVSTTLKRSFRVAGFLAAPVMTLPAALPVAAFGVLALGTGVLWSSPPINRPASRMGGLRPRPVMTAALLAHQMHYFSYYAAVVAALAMTYGPVDGTIGFVMGWISYISAPHLAGRRLPPETLVVGGHVGLALVLALLAAAMPGGWGWLILWILTGFFGGTVVYLTGLARQRFGFDEAALTGTENAGHALGALVACLWLATGGAVGQLFLIAAVFALMTAALVGHAVRRRGGALGVEAP
jgi:hypothetical protein